jgi:hypothetical protein
MFDMSRSRAFALWFAPENVGRRAPTLRASGIGAMKKLGIATIVLGAASFESLLVGNGAAAAASRAKRRRAGTARPMASYLRS